MSVISRLCKTTAYVAMATVNRILTMSHFLSLSHMTSAGVAMVASIGP
jgi:hypothetical protein